MKITNMMRFILIYGLLFWATLASANTWTIAIDPGHGGKDPGAIGRNLKIYEKNVTLSIAKELKALLDKDPSFRAVLTRNGDYYISVPERSEIARKYKANYLVSIHADSSEASNLRGASVWVLSNRRANDEMGQWLEDHEKRSELLGGAGRVLASHNEKYLDQTVLDLQFGHSQRVGYELGSIVLRHFSQIASLNRATPRHASLGVLRSPDIPSILVETGFLSNSEEELKLSTSAYRKQIAKAIYNGLVEYRRKNFRNEPKIVTADKNEKTSEKSTAFDVKDGGIRHKVKVGDSLSQLAEKYQVSSNDIVALNQLKRKELLVGETLKIPATAKPEAENKKAQTNKTESINKRAQGKDVKNSRAATDKATKASENNPSDVKKAMPKYHIVKQDETLYAIAREYKISPNKLLKLNPKLKDGKVFSGQKIQLLDDNPGKK